MADQPLRNAGQSIAKGAANTADALSEGRILDAAESAWEGTATAAKDVAKSAAKMMNETAHKDKDKS